MVMGAGFSGEELRSLVFGGEWEPALFTDTFDDFVPIYGSGEAILM